MSYNIIVSFESQLVADREFFLWSRNKFHVTFEIPHNISYLVSSYAIMRLTTPRRFAIGEDIYRGEVLMDRIPVIRDFYAWVSFFCIIQFDFHNVGS